MMVFYYSAPFVFDSGLDIDNPGLKTKPLIVKKEGICERHQFCLNFVVTVIEKNILIIDEVRFSRVCYAILEFEGYRPRILTNIKSFDTYNVWSHTNNVGLVITSFPFCLRHLVEIKANQVPFIFLSDQINNDLLHLLECRDDSYCMIKPLDYQKFKFLVKQVINGELKLQGGYCLV
jgi:hypothetical protein